MLNSIGLAQIEVIAGNPRKNLESILKKIEEAKKINLKMVIFPEMSVPGYLLGDEWENESFVKNCVDANSEILKASKEIVVVWGNVDIDDSKRNEDGRIRKYNSAYVAQNGKLIGKTYKSLMPKYREFDDERHFYSMIKLARDEGKKIDDLLQPIEVTIDEKKIKLGVMLCEDMWHKDYTVNPSKILRNNGANILINISCSPWTKMKNHRRQSLIQEIVNDTGIPFIYCNNIGTQNNGKNIFIFDGGSAIFNEKGDLLAENDDFCEAILTTNSGRGVIMSEEEKLEKAIVFGIKDFFEKLGAKKAVIGLSGGIDSAVSASLLVKALGKDRVLAINMPSKYNSDLTKNAAEKLADNLGVEYKVIPIQESVDWTVKQLTEANIEVSELVKENIQARDRGSRILAAVAAGVGGVFINNGNKTETALGYATLYGDVGGAIAPIADLYKGEVYGLARWINRDGEIIPKEIMDVVPSAELSAEQDVTQGKGDPIIYPYHDKLIRAFVEWRWDIEKVLEKYDANTLSQEFGMEKNIGEYFETRKQFIEDLEEKWGLYKKNIFKRIQAPPIIAVSRRAFGFDLRESQNGVYLTDRYKKSAL